MIFVRGDDKRDFTDIAQCSHIGKKNLGHKIGGRGRGQDD